MPTLGNTKQTIHWGGVVKGAAIVAAVAVAGIAVAWATPYVISAVTTWLGTGTTSSLLAAGAEGVASIWQAITLDASLLAGKLAEWWAAVPGQLGLTQTLANVPAMSAAAQPGSAVAIAAGAVAAAAAVPAAARALNNTSFVKTVSTRPAVTRPAPFPPAAAPASAPAPSGQGHHASWAERNPSQRAAGAGFASAVPQPAANAQGFAATVSPRGTSHVDAEALRDATANLNRAL